MKTLLRSCFIADVSDDAELFQRNYLAMVDAHLGFEAVEDNLIWTFISDFFRVHSHVPSITTIRAHYERISEMEVVDRLEALVSVKPFTRGDFIRHLEEKSETRKIRHVLEYAKTMAKICETGWEEKSAKGQSRILQGSVDAMRFILEKSHDIVAPTLGGKLSGGLLGDTDTFKNRYERIKADPEFGLGQNSGLRQLDEAMGGAKKGELWTHAAFTGGMKSSLALHWAYNQAVYYQNDSLYFSLEMPYAQCQNILHVMHSFHEKFRQVRVSLGLQPPSKKLQNGDWAHYDRGLDYEKIKYAQLNAVEEKFLFEHVEPDFKNAANAYGEVHLEVADPDQSDFTMADLRSKAEILYSKHPFQMIFIDHMGLMAPRKWVSSTTERQNEVIRDVKRMAMSFNRGQGMAVVGLFQINREGYRAAEKAEGKYNLTHLSYANECTVGETPLWTSRGLVPIKAIRVGDQVWSRSGWKPVLDVFDQGKKPTLEVTVDTGAQIRVTASHRVRVIENEQIVWKEANALNEGDWMISTSGEYPFATVPPELPPLSFENNYENRVGNRGLAKGLELTVPSRLTEEAAYLLGAWDGDGTSHPDGVGFTGNRNEVDVRQRIAERFEQAFNHPLPKAECPSRPGSFDMLKTSRPLKRWLEDLSGPRGKAVPEVILRAPREMVLAYLQGLFDTDGWINTQGIVGLKMASENFLREVQMLMAALGYDTNLSQSTTHLTATNKDYEGWTLRLRGRDMRRKFRDEVGFTEPAKALRLDQGCAPTKRADSNKIYPVSRTFVAVSSDHAPYSLITKGRLPRSFYNVILKCRKGAPVPHDALGLLLQILEEDGVEDVRADLLREVYDLHVLRIAKVEGTGETEQVFDIEVDGDHEYQTGPVLSHNCEKSSDVVTASWIDDDLRNQGRFFMQCLKSRDQKPFERFPVRVEFHCRRLLTDESGIDMDTAKAKQDNQAIGDEIDFLEDVA